MKNWHTTNIFVESQNLILVDTLHYAESLLKGKGDKLPSHFPFGNLENGAKFLGIR